MIIIFGWTTKGTAVRPLLDTYCYECKRQTTWDWYRLAEWVTAFFVPVLPVKSEHYLVCQGCRDQLQLQSDEVRDIKRLKQLSKDASQTLHDRLVQRLEDRQLDGKTETQKEYLKTRRNSSGVN
jgi:hypothetical protein